MSATLLRLGLWIVLIVIAAYVLHETFEESPMQEYFAPAVMQKALALGGLLIVAGIVARLLERGAKVVSKNRCAKCRTPIAKGAIYCREHLRNILHEEDDRTHMTRIRP
jgi:predicted nucleic acid-binding Zn ribbon protein